MRANSYLSIIGSNVLLTRVCERVELKRFLVVVLSYGEIISNYTSLITDTVENSLIYFNHTVALKLSRSKK